MGKFKVGDKVVKTVDGIINKDDICEITDIDDNDCLLPYRVTRSGLTEWCSDGDISLYTDHVDDALDALRYCVNDTSITTIAVDKINDYIIGRNENDMNKVLELYAKRKREEIDKKYKEQVEKDYNDLELVKQYNEIIKDFEIKMDELYNNELNIGESTIHQCYTSSDYKYALNCDIKNSIEDIYSEEHNKEIKAINDLVEEVEAQLSLSNDLDYQREVLTAYGIVDKKSGKIK